MDSIIDFDSTSEKEVTQVDVGILATNRVKDVNYFNWHQRANCLGENKRGRRPSKNFYLSGNINYENVGLVCTFGHYLFNFVDYLFRLSGKEIQSSKNGSIGSELMHFHHLNQSSSYLLIVVLITDV
jgi:hypothetical protein